LDPDTVKLGLISFKIFILAAKMDVGTGTFADKKIFVKNFNEKSVKINIFGRSQQM